MSKFLPIGTKGELLNSDMIARIIPKEDGGCIILTKDGQHFHSEIDLHDEVNDYNSIRSIIPCQGVSAVYLDDDGDSEICPCVFCAGVARLPKPRLASFLGNRSPHATAGLLPADLLLPASATALADGPCCRVRAVRWRNLPVLPPDRFAPNPEFGNGYLPQIFALFRGSSTFLSS